MNWQNLFDDLHGYQQHIRQKLGRVAFITGFLLLILMASLTICSRLSRGTHYEGAFNAASGGVLASLIILACILIGWGIAMEMHRSLSCGPTTFYPYKVLLEGSEMEDFFEWAKLDVSGSWHAAQFREGIYEISFVRLEDRILTKLRFKGVPYPEPVKAMPTRGLGAFGFTEC
jgi:hypothetical protein